MSRKNGARWAVTIAAGLLFVAAILAEATGGGMTRALECMGKSPIARLLATSNAFTLVP